MSKLNITTILVGVAAILAFFGFWTAGGIAPYIILIGGIVGILGTLNIYHLGTYSKANHSWTAILTIATVLFVLVPQIQFTGLAGGMSGAIGSSQTLSTTSITNPSLTPAPAAATGEPVYGSLNFRPTEQTGDAYSYTTSRVYLLDPSVTGDVYTFDKYLAQSNTGLLLAPGKQAVASPKAAASNAFTWSGQSMSIGQEFLLAGYEDATPAAGDNVSFVKKARVVGATSGSTPEIVWQFEDSGSNGYTWRNYAYTGFNDSSGTGRTNYTEVQTSTGEKHVKVDVYPLNLGETVRDGYLWLEAPAANAGAIIDITVTEPDGTPHIYTAFTAVSNIAPGSPLGMSQPSLTVGTNTMYAVGSFGKDFTRTGNSGVEKATYTIDVRYNHPASGNVNMYLKDTYNTNALTSTGGHFDGGKLNINMTDSGTVGGTWT